MTKIEALDIAVDCMRERFKNSQKVNIIKITFNKKPSNKLDGSYSYSDKSAYWMECIIQKQLIGKIL